MTTRPQLRLGNTLLPGILAIALFLVMALIVLTTSFEAMAGFPEDVSITRELGYAMFDFSALQSTDGSIGATEPFLISFLLIAVVLDAALDASLVLAKREEAGEPVTALSSVSNTEADTGSSVGSNTSTSSDASQSGSSTASDGGMVQPDREEPNAGNNAEPDGKGTTTTDDDHSSTGGEQS